MVGNKKVVKEELKKTNQPIKATPLNGNMGGYQQNDIQYMNASNGFNNTQTNLDQSQ